MRIDVPVAIATTLIINIEYVITVWMGGDV